jgi:integrase
MSLHLSYRPVTKKNKDGLSTSPLYLRIRSSVENSESTINTGVDVEIKYWRNGSVSPRHPNFTTIQRMITKVREDVEKIILDLIESNKVPSPKLIKKKYDELIQIREQGTLHPVSFSDSWEKFLYKKKVETSFYTYRMYNQLYKRLQEFSKDIKVTLSFEYICSEDFELDYKQWSIDKRGHTNSYIRKNLTSLKSFLNYCERNQYTDIRIRNYKKPRELEKKEIIYLTRNEVLKLSETKKYDYKENKVYRKEIVQIKDFDRNGKELYFNNWELSKDLFLMMCVLGCRWSDIHHLTWDSQNFDNETFTWENQKTKKYTTVPLDPIGIEILKKYGKGKSRDMKIFPKYSQQKFNDSIKKVCKDMGFKRLVSISTMMGTKTIRTNKVPLYQEVSSHTGRRTFIMNLLKKGLDYKTIMTMTGHSDVKSLMKYISVDEDRVELGRNIYSESDVNFEDIKSLFNLLTDENKQKVIEYVKLHLR